MDPKFLADPATRTCFTVPQRLARLHSPGVGLDFFFHRHDSETTFFVLGARCGTTTPHRPFSRFPRKKLPLAAARKKKGGGVLFSNSQGRGHKTGGAAQAAGACLTDSDPTKSFSASQNPGRLT